MIPKVGDVLVFVPTDDAFKVQHLTEGGRVWMSWCANAKKRWRSAALPLDETEWRIDA